MRVISRMTDSVNVLVRRAVGMTEVALATRSTQPHATVGKARAQRPPIFANAARMSSGAESFTGPVSSTERTAFSASIVA